eukprot:TRINITY_DN2059_c0_g1_i1.p1 TRINITY_DN2059_c0_g1~~TRINITY_DN2059_c0_g1_i1.p1  ORF type:complete len:424 (+),score=29.22 TRINITY_DN2059_c0_g1_i1:1275-2546(+)
MNRKRARQEVDNTIQETTESHNESTIDVLPNEILITLFDCLVVLADKANCSATCRRWWSIVRSGLRHLDAFLELDRAYGAASKFPFLQSLHIAWPKDGPDSDSLNLLGEIARKCPMLQTLSLHRPRGDFCYELRTLTALCELRLYFGRNQDPVMSAPLPSLTSLYIVGCRTLCFENVVGYSSLQTLHIQAKRVELGPLPDALRVLLLNAMLTEPSTPLSSFPNLTELDLGWAWTDEPRDIVNLLGLSLCLLTDLRSLVYADAADQEFALALSNLSRLTRLELLGEVRVSLTLPTSIASLDIGEVEMVTNLHQMSRLTHICAIDGWHDANLYDVPHLESLCFDEPLSDDYSRFSSLQSLRQLQLNYPVDWMDTSLSSLTMLTSLKMADCDGGLSVEGRNIRAVLNRLLPKCVVTFAKFVPWNWF